MKKNTSNTIDESKDIRAMLNLPKIGDELTIPNKNPMRVIESKVMDEAYEGHERLIIQIIYSNRPSQNK